MACGTILIARNALVDVFSDDPMVESVGGLIVAAQTLPVTLAAVSGLITGTLQASGKGAAANVMGTITGFGTLPFMVAGSLAFGFNGLVWSTLVANTVALAIGAIIWLRAFRTKIVYG